MELKLSAKLNSFKLLSKLNSSKLLRYSGWNLAALLLPLFVGLVTIPFLFHRIGIEKFGVLSLIWALVGYFSLFDFGIAKALTKKLAEGRLEHDIDKQRQIFWTSILLMFIFGLLGGGLLAGLMQSFGPSFIKVSPSLHDEVYSSMMLMAAFVPFMVVTSGLRGAMEAYEQFRSANIIRLLLGVWMFLAPAISAWLGYDTLSDIACVVLFGRLLAAIASWVIVSQTLGNLGAPQFERRLVRPLVSYGAWLTLSGALGPLMSYADKFLVGFIVGAVAVAYYATPQDIAMRLLLLPIAINVASFPILTRAIAAGDGAEILQILRQALRYTVLSLLPIVMLAEIFPAELLALWLDSEIASHSAPVLQLITAGVLINGIGVVMLSVLNAAGRPDVQGKLYLIELPFYLFASYSLTVSYGVTGAAWAWMVRAVLDAVLIWVFTRPHLNRMATVYLWAIVLCLLANVFAVGVQKVFGVGVKIILYIVVCAAVVLTFEKLLKVSRHTLKLLHTA